MQQYVIGRNNIALAYNGKLMGVYAPLVKEINLGRFITNGDLDSKDVWKDGNKIYYNSAEYTYEFDKSTSTWVSKKWKNIPYSFFGNYIWTDGVNLYHSNGVVSGQFILTNGEWVTKEWFTTDGRIPSNPYRWNPSSTYIWTDGSNIYYSDGLTQKVLNPATSTWDPKKWTFSDIPVDRVLYGNYVWSDGSNIYCSSDSYGTAKNYRLNQSTSEWESVTFRGGPNKLNGKYVWRTQNNTYYSDGTHTYKLTPSTRTWTDTGWTIEVSKPWYDGQYWHSSNGYDGGYILDADETSWAASNHKVEMHLMGSNMWHGGNRVFMSIQPDQNSLSTTYELDLATNTLSETGLTTDIIAENVWNMDENTYYSRGSTQLQFDPQTSTWSNKTWYGLTNFVGRNVWTDGVDTYYSDKSSQYVLNKETSTWSIKTWSGARRPYSARGIWRIDDRVFYSVKGGTYSGQLVKNPGSDMWVPMDWGGWSPEAENVWQFNGNVYCTGYDYSYKLKKTTMTWEEVNMESMGFIELAYVIGSNVFSYGNKSYYISTPAEYVIE